MANNINIGYKSFDVNFCADGIQFQVGKEYTFSSEVQPNNTGFVVSENPKDALTECGIDNPARYALVEYSGILENWDLYSSSVECTNLKIIKELSLKELIDKIIESEIQRAKPKKDFASFDEVEDFREVAATEVDYAVSEAVAEGCIAAASGDFSVAVTTESYSVSATTGRESISSSFGDGSKIITTGKSSIAISNATKSIIESTGESSIAISLRDKTIIKAGINSAIIFILKNDAGQLIEIKSAIVDGINFEPDTYYKLNDHGEISKA